MVNGSGFMDVDMCYVSLKQLWQKEKEMSREQVLLAAHFYLLKNV